MAVKGMRTAFRELVDLFKDPEDSDDIHVAVLGTRRTGKSRFIELLASHPVSRSGHIYHETVSANTIVTTSLELLRVLNLNDDVRPVLEALEKRKWVLHDLPGDGAFQEWEEALCRASVCFYLLNMSELMRRDLETEIRVTRDMEQINGWVERLDEGARPHLMFVGTHCDRTNPDLTSLSTDMWDDYSNSVRQLPIIQRFVAASGPKAATLVLGSMKSQRDAEVLLSRAFSSVFHHIIE